MRRIIVASPHHNQYYHRLLYDSLRSAVDDRPIRLTAGTGADSTELREAHVFHLHSPEDLPFGPVLERHRALADALAQSGTRLIWTQHNFEPHDKQLVRPYRPIYDEWARRADTVVHHSSWGMAECARRFPFRPDADHRVVPHGHFGPLMPELDQLDPRQCRAELGLRPDLLCLAIIGHPRAEKQVTMAMRAFAAADRDDMQLLVLSAREGDVVPEHPRIVGIPHRPLPRPDYNRRLRAVDVALMPFGSGMLTTGSVADAIALGIPAIISDWPYLSETLGDAGIPYGSGEEALAGCIAGLTNDQLDAARAEMHRKQQQYAYPLVATIALTMLRDTVRRSAG